MNIEEEVAQALAGAAGYGLPEPWRERIKGLLRELKACREENLSMDKGLRDRQVEGTRIHRWLAKKSGHDKDSSHIDWDITYHEVCTHVRAIEQCTKEACVEAIDKIDGIEGFHGDEAIRKGWAKQAIEGA